MEQPAPRVTSAHIRTALKLRYPPQSHALLFEVAPRTGGGTRYADAVAVGLWASHGHAIEGIEIKVSRSDFLSEMKQPEKSQPVFQYCNRWWLACPKGMVEKSELPETWGLLELCGTTLRQKVKAPKLSPTPISIGFLAALIRRHAGNDEEMARQELKVAMAAFELSTREQLKREYEGRYIARAREVEEGRALIEQIKQSTGIDLADYHAHQGGLMRAVRWALDMGARYDGIERLRELLHRAVQSIDETGLCSTDDVSRER